MIETVIVPLDGSQLAESALPLAREIQDKFAAKLVLLRAVESLQGVPSAGLLDPPAAVASEIELTQKVQDAASEDAAAYLQAVVRQLAPATMETLVMADQPADAIVQTAAERPNALIVMSSRGRSGLSRLVFGSVAEAVLRNSTAPVLVVKSPA
jgi:nucleotide-binding universal stress UspA family protein